MIYEIKPYILNTLDSRSSLHRVLKRMDVSFQFIMPRPMLTIDVNEEDAVMLTLRAISSLIVDDLANGGPY